MGSAMVIGHLVDCVRLLKKNRIEKGNRKEKKGNEKTKTNTIT